MKNCLLLSSIVLTQSCANLGPVYQPAHSFPSKDKAIITIYRPWKYVGSIGDPYTCLDHKAVGEFYNGAYYHLEVTPGDHYITYARIDGASPYGVTFNAKKGEQYYLRYDVSKLSGAKEETQLSLNSSVGYVGGATTSFIFSSKKEIEAIIKNVDQRIQKNVNNAGLFFITKELAESELPDTKTYYVKAYDTKACNE